MHEASFLMPLKEGRKEKIVSSQEADKKACLKLTNLLDTLAKHNNIQHNEMSKLNSFIRRVLFCFFAEDTGIFSYTEDNMFTNAFNKMVDKHGGNAHHFFEMIFKILNTKPEQREQFIHQYPKEIMAFPYVNGGLFGDDGFIPEFDLVTRNQLLDCGQLSWKEISPAIFGAMFQGAMNKEERRTLGAHYTSEENILKVIKPLFLDKLYTEFEELKKESEEKIKEIDAIPPLKKKRANHVAGYSDFLSQKAIDLDIARKDLFRDFLKRIGKMKFLDPACGCGNFLLISYKMLRQLENEVLEYINEGNFTDSYININQFYGIEIEDWPAEIAHVSMWLMQHLLNQEANQRFGSNIQSIPLKTSATIVTDNALTIDWNDVLPAEDCSYILGNPPFGGAVTTTVEQKEWLKSVYPPKYKIDRADFVTAWFVKASNYMLKNQNVHACFVATNSICQGQQVSTLWGLLLEKGVNINFAYTSFPWKNDATDKAGVTCIIVGFSLQKELSNILYVYDAQEKNTTAVFCNVISPYLTKSDAPIIVRAISSPLSTELNLSFGNMPVDGGCLLFDYEEEKNFIKINPESSKFIKKFIGSSELIKGEFRYCLWLTPNDKEEWSKIESIMNKVNKCREWREKQKITGDAFKLREKPWSFRSQFNPDSALLIPAVSSENRQYVPMDFIKSDTISSNRNFILPYASNYEFGILTSKMHMSWMRFTSGRLETRYNYSRDLTFNTFIWPEATEEQKEYITNLAKNIRRIRAQNAPMSLGDMYNPKTMPEELKQAHEVLDRAVEALYQPEPFKNDEERVALLLNLYSKKIAEMESK
ncbi:MAG: N-6 DNA methylase [Succinatimonas sp.]|nr:N-6 DNA methylase [Succinatimonas sp.]